MEPQLSLSESAHGISRRHFTYVPARTHTHTLHFGVDVWKTYFLIDFIQHSFFLWREQLDSTSVADA